MPRIAVMDISKKNAVAMFLSFQALYESRKDPNGPLHRIIGWFKDENGREFDKTKIKLGKSEDDFVAMYYMRGVRYKIGKDGKAFVSGADADDMFEREEKDLQLFIDTLLLDELLKSMSKTLMSSGIYVAKTKYINDIDGMHTRSITGVKGE